MIRKRLTMALLAVCLSACGDQTEEGASDEKQSRIDAERSNSQFKITSDTNATQLAEKRSEKLAQNTGKRESRLPQMMAEDPSDADDQMADIKEIEQYRQEYAEAVDVEEKAEALITLVQADEENAVAVLQDAYASPEPVLRKEAVLQMQDFSEKTEVVDMLLKALDDPDPDVATEAVEGLSGVEDQRVIDALKKVAQSHPDETVREAAQDYVTQANEND